MPKPVRSAKIGHNKHQGHDDGRSGEKLSQNDDFFDGIEVIDVRRNNEEHGRGGDADPISKVTDIETPRNLVFHIGYDQSSIQLFRVEANPHTNDSQ